VSLPDGWAVGTIVLPETGGLKPSVRFLGRGTESLEAAEATKRLDRLDAEEDDREAEIEQEESGPVEKPKPIDWLAGIVAVSLQLGMILGVIIGVMAGAIWLLRRVF
jgi:hypothetical protein